MSTTCPSEPELRHAVGATRAYFTPIVVLIGVLGNIATLVIFALEARLSRWNRFGIYCSALAVSDAGVLLVSGLLDDFLGRGLMHATGRWVLKLDTVSVGSCKLLEFLQNYFLFVSAHLLLAFTVDRLLGVWKPLRFAARGCVRQTVGVVLAVCLAGLVLNAPAAVVYDVTEEWHAADNATTMSGVSAVPHLSRTCHVSCNATAENGLANFAIYYKGFGIFVVPFLLQVALSATLLCLLLRARRRRQELLSPTSSPTSASRDSQRIELSRYYANLALSLASCLLAAPLCVAIVMRANCGVCDPRNSCRCRYLAQLTKLLDSVQDASFAAGFWVYLACVASFRQRVAFAGAVVCLTGRCINGGDSVNWAPVRRAEELLARSQRRRRPGAYASSLMNKRQSSSHGGGGGGGGGNSIAVGNESKTVELLPLAFASPTAADQ